MNFLLPELAFKNPVTSVGLWSISRLQDCLQAEFKTISTRSVERLTASSNLLPKSIKLVDVKDEENNPLKHIVRSQLEGEAKRKRTPSLIIQQHKHEKGFVLMANDGRYGRRWLCVDSEPNLKDLEKFLYMLALDYKKDILIWPHRRLCEVAAELVREAGTHNITLGGGYNAMVGLSAYHKDKLIVAQASVVEPERNPIKLNHLDRLEAESIHIIREAVAEAENPVMLHSIGKDSSVMLRLAEKAFYPGKPPFPLLHVDTRWKFKAMYESRNELSEKTGLEMIVHINPEGIEKNINPFDHGSSLHTDVMKTQGLIQALGKYKFDVAFGGARRDEEKSRAKERVFSFRNRNQHWDPKNQRPELWNLYNGRRKPGENIRVFPLSNWTELDIWQYIYKESIPIVPLYFAAERPVISRDGMLILVDDDRLNLFPGEKIEIMKVRFRTLGCYPLTGAIASDADSLPKILLELFEAKTSERQGRAIDNDSSSSMEKKKKEGYF
jgi:sulfate adenylyltransferase subunit 2